MFQRQRSGPFPYLHKLPLVHFDEQVLLEAVNACDMRIGTLEDEDGVFGVPAGETGNRVWVSFDLGKRRVGVVLSLPHVPNTFEVKLGKVTGTGRGLTGARNLRSKSRNSHLNSGSGMTDHALIADYCVPAFIYSPALQEN